MHSDLMTIKCVPDSVKYHKQFLEFTTYELSYEYNTLVKAKAYYAQKGLDTQGNPLHHSFKDAAKGRQKRQIVWCKSAYVEAYDNYTKNPSEVSNTWYTRNFFKDEVTHKEVRENLFFVKLYLIQASKVLEYLQSEKSNCYTNDQYDAKIESLEENWYYDKHKVHIMQQHYANYNNEVRAIIEDCCDQYRKAYDIHKGYKESYIKNAPSYLRDSHFKDIVHNKFSATAAEAASKKIKKKLFNFTL